MAVEAQHMAVEAQHLRLFKAATATSTRECMDKKSMYKARMGLVDYADDYASCATMSNGGGSTSRKRPRDVIDVNPRQMDDCLIAQHVERMRAEMTEGKMRFARQVISLVDEKVSRRMRAKDEEIEQMKKLNSVLEERMKALATENQVWQYLAQTNEAAAAALRANLQHVLAQQQAGRRVLPDGDDAGSCCGDNFEEGAAAEGGGRRPCRSCSAHQASVLLLPCRHLCLCATCARATDTCPICRCCRTGSVNVNLS